MEEFASLSGISRPTISKYFHDPTSVRHSTRARIESALERYDYRPNIYAINQNRRLTRNIGIMVPYLVDPFFAEIARNIEHMCIGAGFRPLLFSSHGSTAQETANLETLRDVKPAGALIAPLGRHSDKSVVERFCADVPTVLFDSEMASIDATFVGSNNSQSIAMIVDYLCANGEPPTFFELRSPPNPNAIKRRKAYRAALRGRGTEPRIIQVDGEGWDFEEIGYREGLKVLRRSGFQTGTILCSNDRLAIGLLAAAYELGLRVGSGSGCALRIAGHDDHPFARYTCPTLTTVAQDYEAIAARSFEALVSGFADPALKDKRETVVFDGKLVIRQSA